MLTRDELIKELTIKASKGFIEKLAVKLKEQNFDIKTLVDITFHENHKTGFRAAWLLDTIMLESPLLYTDDFEYLIKRMAEVNNASWKRHYARVMMHITSPNMPEEIKQKLTSIDMENTVEQCFDWMIDAKVKVAVKAFAAEVLFNLSNRNDWIKDELTNQLLFLMRNGSPAIQSRGKKLLAAIKR